MATHVKQNKIIDDVCQIISEIPELNRMKLDPELTVYVCNIIENLIDKGETKEISKLNIELSAKTQKEIIINTGKEVIGQERVNRAIKYLDRYITNRTFIKIE